MPVIKAIKQGSPLIRKKASQEWGWAAHKPAHKLKSFMNFGQFMICKVMFIEGWSIKKTFHRLWCCLWQLLNDSISQTDCFHSVKLFIKLQGNLEMNFFWLGNNKRSPPKSTYKSPFSSMISEIYIYMCSFLPNVFCWLFTVTERQGTS